MLLAEPVVGVPPELLPVVLPEALGEGLAPELVLPEPLTPVPLAPVAVPAVPDIALFILT